MDTTEPTYTTSQAIALSGASERQIHYWADKGIIGHELAQVGSGRYRKWTPDQVRIAHGITRAAELMRQSLDDLVVGDQLAGMATDDPEARWAIITTDTIRLSQYPEAHEGEARRGALTIPLTIPQEETTSCD